MHSSPPKPALYSSRTAPLQKKRSSVSTTLPMLPPHPDNTSPPSSPSSSYHPVQTCYYRQWATTSTSTRSQRTVHTHTKSPSASTRIDKRTRSSSDKSPSLSGTRARTLRNGHMTGRCRIRRPFPSSIGGGGSWCRGRSTCKRRRTHLRRG